MIRQRILTAVILALALLLVLFVVPPVAAIVLLALFLALGAWEWSRLAGFEAPIKQAGFIAAAVFMGLLAVELARRGGLSWLPWLDLAVWVAALYWMLRFPVSVPAPFAVISGLLVLPLGWLFLSLILTQWGPTWLLFLFAITAAADVGAFFSGRALGRNKLAPAVSPGKTWEGVAGGLVCAGIVGYIGALWFGLPAVSSVLMAAVIAGFSILGDLTVSMLKRHVGIKDSGSIFPGHGGVLDRIDSLLAAVPLFLIAFAWVSGI